MDGHISAYPAGHEVRLDFSLELGRLEGRTANFRVEEFNPRNRADLEAVVRLELECLGDGGVFSAERVTDLITHGYVARSQADRSILGFIWTAPESPGSTVQCIMGLGRKAGACRLNIGELLMRELIEKQVGPEFVLQVRESNTPAISLYQRLGFEQVRRIPGYYRSPTEDAFTMSLNRANYQPLEVVA